MRRLTTFFHNAEDVVLWAGPFVRGNFSYLGPSGTRHTVVFWRGDLTIFSAESYVKLGEKWGWYE